LSFRICAKIGNFILIFPFEVLSGVEEFGAGNLLYTLSFLFFAKHFQRPKIKKDAVSIRAILDPDLKVLVLLKTKRRKSLSIFIKLFLEFF